jgi:uncharacterized phage infection (PIP) family protein YhgE
MPAKRKNARKKANSKKPENSDLKLVLKRLDELDQRFDALDRKIDTVDQKVDTVRQETAEEFKAVRGEIAQGQQETAEEFKAVRGEIAQGRLETATEFKAVRGEMGQGFSQIREETAQGFDSLRKHFETEMKHVSNGAYEHYLRIENERRADVAEFRENQRQLLTGMDAMVRNYENYRDESIVRDATISDLQRDVETLKKRDMEKAAAIDKIEKEIDKLKAA